MKPMNCPCHMLIFRRARSARTASSRCASTTRACLHRNELSEGTLSGLTRVRQFSQDDAHIFLRGGADRRREIAKPASTIDPKRVYGAFDMNFARAPLHAPGRQTRRRRRLWDRAEGCAARSADQARTAPSSGINEGDGAFYGPKIDFDRARLRSGREWHQCATDPARLPDAAVGSSSPTSGRDNTAAHARWSCTARSSVQLRALHRRS
jgi:threonyl-tRNA synthetase